MREVHRTFTIRLPILAISITTGCALNFGQVNASGTVNATANADTKIDTTVNASASVDTTAEPAQSNGKIIVFIDGKSSINTQLYCCGEMWDKADGMFYGFLNNSKERPQLVRRVRIAMLPASGSVLPETPLAINWRLEINGTVLDTIIAIPTNHAADFRKDTGLFMISAGGITSIVLRVDWTANGDKQFFIDNFKGRTVYFSIESPSDIETESGAEIGGSFPINDKPLAFSPVI